ncbi:hypothetical protein RND71_030966 [Anisodus tanguticus]|uniref:Uncharacterized protein n=1 Tax=Anisodus tanguticus TaxID=243964 RepID=A0AAE1V089_9SOLA|nr:hypothetical protein RND71_030966 [Anisodus tanguticus]
MKREKSKSGKRIEKPNTRERERNLIMGGRYTVLGSSPQNAKVQICVENEKPCETTGGGIKGLPVIGSMTGELLLLLISSLALIIINSEFGDQTSKNLNSKHSRADPTIQNNASVRCPEKHWVQLDLQNLL